MTIETKYGKGDTVFYMYDNKIVEAQIICIDIHVSAYDDIENQITYKVIGNEMTMLEGKLFSSREEVIKTL